MSGPSVNYDSNWLSGIDVIQLAYDAIRDEHCESAIIGTANLALHSELSYQYNEQGLLSPDGSTCAFDANGKFV